MMVFHFFIKEYVVLAFFIILSTAFFSVKFKDKDYIYYGSLIFVITTLAFFVPFLPLFFVLAAAAILVFLRGKDRLVKLSYYLLLLPVVPDYLYYRIPFPGISQLFTIHYPLLLSIVVLLPLSFSYFFDRKKTLFSRKTDIYVIAFLFFIFLINFRDTTFTNALRMGVFEIFMLSFLVYFAFSRTISGKKDFFVILKPFLFSAVIVSLAALFEFIKFWNLYTPLIDFFGVNFPFQYLFRGGFLRCAASFNHTLTLGIYLVFCIYFLVYLLYVDRKRHLFYVVLLSLFSAALLSTISSTPLVGLAVFFSLFIVLTWRQKISFKLLLVGVLLALVLFVPLAHFLLSRGGSHVDYRVELLKNSLEVIGRLPLTGAGNFMFEPELNLKSGHLRVDMVNAYLGIALQQGIIGLSLFVLIFAHLLINLAAGFSIGDGMVRKMLFSAVVSVSVMIFFVSTGTITNFIVWMLFGLSSAFIHNIDR